jgi:BMFP domain-containing protein YqiC
MLATTRNSWYTVSRMKQSVAATMRTRSDFEGVTEVSDMVWETFDGLFKTLHRQGRRVEELERRVVELERRLQERAAHQTQHAEAVERVTQMPAEKAA